MKHNQPLRRGLGVLLALVLCLSLLPATALADDVQTMTIGDVVADLAFEFDSGGNGLDDESISTLAGGSIEEIVLDSQALCSVYNQQHVASGNAVESILLQHELGLLGISALGSGTG